MRKRDRLRAGIVRPRRLPADETSYYLEVDERTVEQLARGIVSKALARCAWDNLYWKREARRAAAGRPRLAPRYVIDQRTR